MILYWLSKRRKRERKQNTGNDPFILTNVMLLLFCFLSLSPLLGALFLCLWPSTILMVLNYKLCLMSVRLFFDYFVVEKVKNLSDKWLANHNLHSVLKDNDVRVQGGVPTACNLKYPIGTLVLTVIFIFYLFFHDNGGGSICVYCGKCKCCSCW